MFNFTFQLQEENTCINQQQHQQRNNVDALSVIPTKKQHTLKKPCH